jgi:hypothetical protein
MPQQDGSHFSIELLGGIPSDVVVGSHIDPDINQYDARSDGERHRQHASQFNLMEYPFHCRHLSRESAPS